MYDKYYTIAAGDNMYLYGGTVDDSGSIVQDWAVYQAQSAADLLGLDMSFHPDVNDSFPTPTKATASDQMPFANVGIPYIYSKLQTGMVSRTQISIRQAIRPLMAVLLCIRLSMII